MGDGVGGNSGNGGGVGGGLGDRTICRVPNPNVFLIKVHRLVMRSSVISRQGPANAYAA